VILAPSSAGRPGLPRKEAPTAIYTIGHGNRPLDELTSLLHAAGVTCLVDVRAFPGSRRHPQFGRGELQKTLPQAHIDYVWEGASLGGRRKPRADSPHSALRNASFRAYADHMESETFREGIRLLLRHARQGATAIMCAERLPWQCHRYMIADYLVAHGVDVLHIIDTNAPKPHRLRAEARLTGGCLIYDAAVAGELGLD
jgi:uncharacterized protein (DUF488 family)